MKKILKTGDLVNVTAIMQNGSGVNFTELVRQNAPEFLGQYKDCRKPLSFSSLDEYESFHKSVKKLKPNFDGIFKIVKIIPFSEEIDLYLIQDIVTKDVFLYNECGLENMNRPITEVISKDNPDYLAHYLVLCASYDKPEILKKYKRLIVKLLEQKQEQEQFWFLDYDDADYEVLNSPSTEEDKVYNSFSQSLIHYTEIEELKKYNQLIAELLFQLQK